MKYNKKESSTLEFKREVPSKQQIIKTIIAFCNTYGGILVVGIDDDLEIVGVDENSVDQLIEDIHRSIYASCTPSIIPSLYTQRIENKILLFIEVSDGMLKPYFLSSLGKLEGTFIRVGTETVKASPRMIQELEWQSLGKYPDEMPLYGVTQEAIDLSLFDDFLKKRKGGMQPDDQDVKPLLYNYHVLTTEHGRTYPTKAGILLFSLEPQKYLSEAFVICTHYLGVSGREVIATKDCLGNLMQQYKDCIAFILSRLNHQFVIKGTHAREDVLEIPEEAIREAVINALIHRDYQISGPIKISIYDDRIEIFSPGTFPGPIETDRLTAGMTYVRNVVIARAFRAIGLVEKLGSGFLTIFNSYKQRNLVPPIVQEGVCFVKCILSRPMPSYVKKTVEEEKEESLLGPLFQTDLDITVLDVIKKLSVSRSTASRYLKNLVEKGMIEKIGHGPATRYRKKLS
jgi:ATP-dependent DNA helicase RecG